MIFLFARWDMLIAWSVSSLQVYEMRLFLCGKISQRLARKDAYSGERQTSQVPRHPRKSLKRILDIGELDQKLNTLPKTNVASENRPSQMEGLVSQQPFLGSYVSFRECIQNWAPHPPSFWRGLSIITNHRRTTESKTPRYGLYLWPIANFIVPTPQKLHSASAYALSKWKCIKSIKFTKPFVGT